MKELGQLIMTGVSSTSLSQPEIDFFKNEDIGGVLLFSKNFENPAQLAELINSIQEFRKDTPLLIAVDQEGGRVQRFKDPFIKIPSMFDLAKLDSPKLCFELFYQVAIELKSVGVNLNLSPVCDVWFNEKNAVIGDRSFGDKPDFVSKFVSSAIRGIHKAEILSCAKHFPGHGNTLKDSHHHLPFIKTSLEKIIKNELPTFLKATKSKVDFVMMAHLQIDSIDDKFPTSLSKNAYNLLRDKLRFDDLIITDDMQMGAITKKYGTGEAATLAVSAGADIIEYRDMDCAKDALAALKLSYENGTLNQSETKIKLDKITRFKTEKLGEYKPIYLPEIPKKFNNPEKLFFVESLNEQLSK